MGNVMLCVAYNTLKLQIGDEVFLHCGKLHLDIIKKLTGYTVTNINQLRTRLKIKFGVTQLVFRVFVPFNSV